MKNNRNRPPVNIRLARKDEAPAVGDLLYYSFADQQAFYTPEAFAATTPGVAEIAGRIAMGAVWVATVDGRIAGTVTLFPKRNGILVRSLAVAPFARRGGIGRQLMNHAEEVGRQRGALYVELTTTWFLGKARQLYNSLGFKERGAEDLFGTPLIKLKKNLKGSMIPTDTK